MIKSFKSRKLKRLYDGDRTVFSFEWIEKMENILFYLDNAQTPQELNLPGYHLHALKGNLKGFWSVSVSGNWRIIFKFEDGHAYVVNFIDYH